MVLASIPEDSAAMPASLHDTIAAAIRSVLSDTGRSAHEISPSSLLGSDLGLDSLDLAQTIVMLESMPFPENLSRVWEYAGSHHETMDGKGYPGKLAAGDLSREELLQWVTSHTRRLPT